MVPLFGVLTTGTLIVVAIVVLLLFGNRIPALMRSLGQGVTEFKKGLNELEDESTPEKTKTVK